MDYVTKMRRELHKNPELGFELPKTVAFIKAQLLELGVEMFTRFVLENQNGLND